MGLSPKRRCGGGNANRRSCPLLVFRVGILSKPQRLIPPANRKNCHQEVRTRRWHSTRHASPPSTIRFPIFWARTSSTWWWTIRPGSAIRRIITPARLSSRRMCCKARCAVRSMMGRLMSITRAIVAWNPGSHHRLSENASKTDPAKLADIWEIVEVS